MSENNNCSSCQSETSRRENGRIVNALYILETPIKFTSGKLANQVWLFDFKKINGIVWAEKYFNLLCYPCLEKLVDQGQARLKTKDVCHLCQREFHGEDNNFDGMTLNENLIDYPGYGSKHDTDTDLYKFFSLQGSKYYCYQCIDTEIDTGRATLLPKDTGGPLID